MADVETAARAGGRTWRFERVYDGGIYGFDIYCDEIPMFYGSTEPAFVAEDLATMQFVVDALNAAEQQAEDDERTVAHGPATLEPNWGVTV